MDLALGTLLLWLHREVQVEEVSDHREEGQEEQRVVNDILPEEKDHRHEERLGGMNEELLKSWSSGAEMLEDGRDDCRESEGSHHAKGAAASQREAVIEFPFSAEFPRPTSPIGLDQDTLEEVGEVLGHIGADEEIVGRVQDDLVRLLRADLMDGSTKTDDGCLNLNTSQIWDDKVQQKSLSGFVEEDLDCQLQHTSNGEEPLPRIASLQSSQHREVDEEEVDQNHRHPGDPLRGAREHIGVRKIMLRFSEEYFGCGGVTPQDVQQELVEQLQPNVGVVGILKLLNLLLGLSEDKLHFVL